MCFWSNFHCYKWPNIEKYFNHLVTLAVNNLIREIIQKVEIHFLWKIFFPSIRCQTFSTFIALQFENDEFST